MKKLLCVLFLVGCATTQKEEYVAHCVTPLTRFKMICSEFSLTDDVLLCKTNRGELVKANHTQCLVFSKTLGDREVSQGE
jgi:hypothetical protein